MKFFHLSDLHIGLKLINRDLREDQEYILEQIVAMAIREQPEAVVIAGDVYDRAVPSAEAVEVFDGFISRLTEALPETEILVISGNHDSGPRLGCFRRVLARQQVHIAGMPPQREDEYLEQVTLEDSWGPVHFYLLPFVRPSMVRQVVGAGESGNSLSYQETVARLLAREEIHTEERNVLVSHQFYLPAGKDPEEMERMDSEVLTVGNIDQVSAEVLAPFDYAALGHIHKPMSVGSSRYRYCGTPLACSVSEAGQQKGVIRVELGPKGEVRTTVLTLTPLRQVRVLRGTLEQVLGQGCGDFVTVVLTDPGDLDVGEMQDRLRAAFPYLLEIRRELPGRPREQYAPVRQEKLPPLELCRRFLGELDAAKEEILRDVIHTVQEGGGE